MNEPVMVIQATLFTANYNYRVVPKRNVFEHPKARAAWKLWGHACLRNAYFEELENVVLYVFQGTVSKHGKALSVTHVVNMEKLVYKVFSSKGHDVCPSDNAHIPLRLMYVKNCRGG